MAVWELFFKSTDFYDLENLSPDSLMRLAESILQDDEIAQKYYHQMRNKANVPEFEDPCDFKCKVVHYCDMTTVDHCLHLARL